MDDSHLLTYSTDGDSDEDVVTDYLNGKEEAEAVGMSGLSGLPGLGQHGGPLVPTISVTPHSPGSKHYPILDDNLAHLHDIHDSVQQMRHAALCGGSSGGGAKLSSSCPSLNDPGSDPDLLSSVTSSPTHGGGSTSTWLSSRGAPDTEVSRRRSWTALEDLTCRSGVGRRQRSISLSSADSGEDPFSLSEHGSTAHLLSSAKSIAVGRRNGTSAVSTHSLNEADLQSDFQLVLAKQVERQRLAPCRLPLQKSISTPSIIAAQDLAPGQPPESDRDTLPVMMRASGTGTESETEEEAAQPYVVHVPPNSHLHLRHFLSQTYTAHSEKRRKRGSLFFRKKKDKKKVAHEWVTPVPSTVLNCDWCGKLLSTKPAVHCESCLKTVHVGNCRDQSTECSKVKMTKHPPKPQPIPKRSSAGPPGTPRKTMLCYSPWKRVATKLGVNHTPEEYHLGHNGEPIRYVEDSFPVELLEDVPKTVRELEADPMLGLSDDEPECWSPTVGRDVLRKLKDKEIKRQEHIYEFILTEKHHCLTLRVMQKVFVEGFKKHFQLGANLDRMFPRLAELTDIHFRLLGQLRLRQRAAPVVETLADILLEQFSGTGAQRLKAAYGEFCSNHRDAVDIYKYYTDNDRRFADFVRHCQQNPLLKKKGIPECILFVTQRLTKYPLLIEPLIKAAKENKQEQERLQLALARVKEILVAVNSQVAEKEKEDRKLEIYNRIDAKSFTVHRGIKFKKSDILSENRQLRFEGTAMLMQGRGKMHYVLVILLSDVLFFLQENNNKYTFFTPDNKAGVVSLQKLLVREKAGQDSKGIYLISSHPAEPEMFELKIHKPKDKAAWIQGVRLAVERCPEDDDPEAKLSTEEKQRLYQAKQSHIRQIVDILRQKDLEQALILEEKMALQLKLLAAAGLSNVPEPPDYCHLVAEHTDTGTMWLRVISAVQEVSQLASSLYASGTSLSRSASSVGERQSDAYVSPTLPKRAETFGGFDNTQVPGSKLHQVLKKHKESGSDTPDKPLMDHFSWRDAVMSALPPDMVVGSGSPPGQVPALLTLGREQQLAAVQLSHYVYTLLCIIWQQMTSIDSLQAQLAACKSQLSSDDRDRERRPAYRHNHQLEELRNLQDRLSHEKEAWQREKEAEEKHLEERKQSLLILQNQIRDEQKDISVQREQLYRKLELLTSQGVMLSPTLPSPTAAVHPAPDDNPIPTTPSSAEPRRRADSHRWKHNSGKANTLPPNLMSTTNQHKLPIQVKQQLPLKLAAAKSPGPGPVTSSASVQQMLPLKLRENPGEVRRMTVGPVTLPPAGYSRLPNENPSSSNTSDGGSCSPTPSSTAQGSHSRTGSSPAMMEHSSSHPGSPARTHSFPKTEEKILPT